MSVPGDSKLLKGASTDAVPTRPMRLFVADDDREMRRLIGDFFRREGHIVLESKDGSELLQDLSEVFRGTSIDSSDAAVVCDVRMPEQDGLSVLRSMATFPWCPPFVLLTAFADPALHARARRLGAAAVLEKPFDMKTLRALVLRLVTARSTPTT